MHALVPWLLLPVVSTAALFAVVLRLRKQAHQMQARLDELQHHNQALEAELAAGRSEPTPPPEAPDPATSLLARVQDAMEHALVISALGANPRTIANPAFERLTGFHADRLRLPFWEELEGPASDPTAVAEIRRAIQQCRPTSVELIHYRSDGTPFRSAFALFPVKDANRHVTHWAGLLCDVTDRRRREEQLRQEYKMEAVARLAGGVSHDFNNLFTVISGYSELVRDMMGEQDPLRGPVDEIHKAGIRATELIAQLLVFGRRQPLVARPIDMNEFLAVRQESLATEAGPDVVLSLEPGAEVHPVNCDPVQLEAALTQLVINAREAMPLGGALILRTANVTRPEGDAVLWPGHYVELQVIDTGCGMAPEVVARLFEPFFTTKNRGRGSGLAIVYGFVKQSGGHIEVTSDPERGSTFALYFPTAGTGETLVLSTDSVLENRSNPTLALV